MSADGLPSGIEEHAPPFRTLCTDCGLSRTTRPGLCGQACQFIRPNYDGLERQVHGRSRDLAVGDERFFGPYRRMVRAWLKTPEPGAQWSGITTRLAARLLTGGHVDAVLTVAPHERDFWRPVPVLVTDASDLAACRGMRMGYAPVLSLLEPARARGLTRIAVIGIPCQVHALRAVQSEFGIDQLYVIGTPCSDNTTTENFLSFLGKLSECPDEIVYLEFRPDYHVEIRHRDGGVREIPFLDLPIADLPDDFFPLTCRTCVDYTNALADITVGYMAGQGQQWIVVRNDVGEKILSLASDDLEVAALDSRGNRVGAVRGFLANTERAAGGLPVRRTPRWLKPLITKLMPKIGPRGLEFARARVEMKAIETILHLRRRLPRRLKAMVPPHVWALVEPYGLAPETGEVRQSRHDVV